MPKDKGKKKTKKKAIKSVGNMTYPEIARNFLKKYEKNCVAENTVACPKVRSMLKESIENETLLTKFILEPLAVTSKDDPVVTLTPLITTLRQERYHMIKDLHIWDMTLFREDLTALALLIEKAIFSLRKIELMDCLIEPEPLGRLSVSLDACATLTILDLDYNEFGDAGCELMCDGLRTNTHLLSVSLNYCDLGTDSGKLLGEVVCSTAICELYVDGNNLGCEGVTELIRGCSEHAEVEYFERLEEEQRLEEERLMREQEEKENRRFIPSSDSEQKGSASDSGKSGKSGKGKKKKKKKGKKKKKKAPPLPPPVGPWIHKLHLADNGVDCHTSDKGLSLITCMRLFRKLITYSSCLLELDLEDNLIGDLGGREVMEALVDRKEAKLGGVKMRTTHRMTADTFNNILKLGTGLKKKKKKKGKKKKR